MPRKLRVQYPGAIYHVMNRGDRRDPIFTDDKDRSRFLDTLGEACAKTGWLVHAYCLMQNHFHLVIETPQPNLVAGMRWFLSTYTSRYNRRHKEFGHLFSGRYKALIVDGSNTGYLKTACDYVHLNPVRAKQLRNEAKLQEFRWSSYAGYLKGPKHRPKWLCVHRLLGEHGVPKDTPAGREEFARRMELRRAAEDGLEFKALLRGWCLGSEEFRKELLAQMREASASHTGIEVRQADELHAEQIVAAELRRRRWKEDALVQRRKGDPEKVKIAVQLRQETTMTLQWIARRLKMGAWTHVSNLLAAQRRKGAPV